MSSFDQTADLFDKFRGMLRNPSSDEEFVETAKKLVSNYGGINTLDLDHIPVHDLRCQATKLCPEQADLDDFRRNNTKYMGSGYSKIYAMLLDDFPIYDSRTACGLTLADSVVLQVLRKALGQSSGAAEIGGS